MHCTYASEALTCSDDTDVAGSEMHCLVYTWQKASTTCDHIDAAGSEMHCLVTLVYTWQTASNASTTSDDTACAPSFELAE